MGPITYQARLLKRTLWARQREICRAVDSGRHRSISIAGCHGSGKTFVLSGLVVWYLSTYADSIVLTVAPTLRQVKLMWNEIHAAIQANRIVDPVPSTTEWRISKRHYALGFSSAKGVNAQGFHASKILLIVDEAIGIDQDLWDAIEGIRAAGDVTVVKACNPTVPAGAPYDDFTKHRAYTTCISISAFDTPNFEGVTIEDLLSMPDDLLDYNPFPALTRRRWVKEMYYKWGPLNPRYQARVLGQFPTQRKNAVYELAWIERSRREPTASELSKLDQSGTFVQVGIDVAGPGDDETACCARVNGIVIARAAFMDADPRGKVVRWLGDLKARAKWPLGPVMIDTIGVGYNFALHIADQGLAQVYGFNAGSVPFDSERFTNAKAEQYFRLRDMLQDNYISHAETDLLNPNENPWDDEEAGQLAGVNYQETSRGLIQIESKDESRARGIDSPDRAEAKVLAFARVIERERMLVYGQPQIISRI